MTLTVAVGMTTAPRPVQTVQDCLLSLRQDAGYHGPLTMFDDGSGANKNWQNIQWQRSKWSRGPLLNWLALLYHLLASGADVLILLEDDLTFAAGAWDVMISDIHKLKGKVWLYSPYSSYTVSKPLKARHGKKFGNGLYAMNFHKKAGGSQCYAITRDAARKLLSDSEWQYRIQAASRMPFDPTRRGENLNADRDGQVSAAMIRQGVPVIYRIPSLLNHALGSANSSYWFKKEQDTEYFEPVAQALENYAIHQ